MLLASAILLPVGRLPLMLAAVFLRVGVPMVGCTVNVMLAPPRILLVSVTVAFLMLTLPRLDFTLTPTAFTVLAKLRLASPPVRSNHALPPPQLILAWKPSGELTVLFCEVPSVTGRPVRLVAVMVATGACTVTVCILLASDLLTILKEPPVALLFNVTT